MRTRGARSARSSTPPSPVHTPPPLLFLSCFWTSSSTSASAFRGLRVARRRFWCRRVLPAVCSDFEDRRACGGVRARGITFSIYSQKSISTGTWRESRRRRPEPDARRRRGPATGRTSTTVHATDVAGRGARAPAHRRTGAPAHQPPRDRTGHGSRRGTVEWSVPAVVLVGSLLVCHDVAPDERGAHLDSTQVPVPL